MPSLCSSLAASPLIQASSAAFAPQTSADPSSPGRKSLHTICTLRIPDRLTRVTASSTTPLLGPAAYSTANTPLSSPKGSSNFALPASLAMTRSTSQHGSVTPNQGRPTPVPSGEDSVRLVKCCFSFTIRRDSCVICGSELARRP